MSLPQDLLRPDAYPLPRPQRVELRETHVSWVYLTESDVFKVKKPVRYPFLDFSTLERRRRACEDEVVLNQRLAASAYLGVVPVRTDASGRCHFGPEGAIVDWAVHMLRLPDALRADERLARGELDVARVGAIAEHVAAFHGRAHTDERVTAWGAPSAIERNMVENFAEVDPAEAGFLTPAQARELRDYQRGFIESSSALLVDRCLEGRIRDGHGDLRLDHVYVTDAGDITILDCIEFSERFRAGDVAADVAFFTMDLAAHGRVDLAERFLADYARAADDYALYELVDFYESYRAYVRGKVSTLLASGSDGDLRRKAEADARRHFALALAAHRRSVLAPVVVAVGGIIASGKSTVARAVGELLSAPIIDADTTRKRLLGLEPTEDASTGAFDGAYDPHFTDKVYAEVMRRASHVLASGRPVVVDASFRTETMRSGARELARAHHVPFLMIECRARPEVCRARLAARDKRTAVSDARQDVFDAFVARTEPMNELTYAERVVVDTERPLPDTLAEIQRRLQTWPRGLVA